MDCLLLSLRCKLNYLWKIKHHFPVWPLCFSTYICIKKRDHSIPTAMETPGTVDLIKKILFPIPSTRVNTHRTYYIACGLRLVRVSRLNAFSYSRCFFFAFSNFAYSKRQRFFCAVPVTTETTHRKTATSKDGFNRKWSEWDFYVAIFLVSAISIPKTANNSELLRGFSPVGCSYATMGCDGHRRPCMCAVASPSLVVCPWHKYRINSRMKHSSIHCVFFGSAGLNRFVDHSWAMCHPMCVGVDWFVFLFRQDRKSTS